jgi:photosystem II stability/assembly factor-like uncharacterized protein
MLIKSEEDNWVLQSKCHFKGNLISTQFLDDSKGWVLGTSDNGSNSSRLYKSMDGGEHWITQISGMSGYLNSFCFVNENVGWVVGINDVLSDAIILKTTNGGESWTDQSFGSDLYLLSVYFADENTGWVVGVDFNGTHEGMIFKTTDGGESWTNQYTTQNIGEYKASFFVDSSTGWVIFFGGGSSTIVKTIDGGENWVIQSSPVYYPSSIYFIDQNIGWITGTSSEAPSVILKTTNGGASWSDQFENDSQYFNSIYFVDQNNGWVAGHDNSYRSIVLATTDGGLNWISQPTGSGRRLNSVYFTDKNTGWLVGENGTILKTTNGGGTIPVELTSLIAFTQSGYVELNWSTATETNNMMFEIERRKENSEFVLIGFVEGRGTTTERQEYSYIDRNVTTGKYFYRLKQIDFDGTFEYTDEIEVDATGPLSFSLEQNYPNPFNPSTKITYSIPNKSFVTLRVYDQLGSLVGELVQEEKEAGRYEIDFNSFHLSSGVYFYSINAGSFVETKKMILLK